VSLKFIEEQPQILRLTTPELHPKEQRPLFGDPELKDVRAPFAQNDSLCFVRNFRLRTLV
jgi:hypothetical protein